MTSASYVVIRYIADPTRGEPQNVGVLAWADEVHRVAISDDAVRRVVREHPRLHTEALRALADVVTESLGLSESPPGSEIRERLGQQRGYPIDFSEPRMTTVQAATADALATTVDRLVERMVKPGRRFGGRPVDMRGLLARALGAEIRAGRVAPNHRFADTRSGVSRTVDFFANSGRNVCIDALRLDLAKADEIRLRADAEANKAADITARHQVQLVVLASLPQREDFAAAGEEARSILTSANVAVVESVALAAARLGVVVE